MKFIDEYDYRRVKEQLSITEVVERNVNYMDREGAVEHLESRVSKIIDIMCMLLENASENTQKKVASACGYVVANK